MAADRHRMIASETDRPRMVTTELSDFAGYGPHGVFELAKQIALQAGVPERAMEHIIELIISIKNNHQTMHIEYIDMDGPEFARIAEEYDIVARHKGTTVQKVGE